MGSFSCLANSVRNQRFLRISILLHCTSAAPTVPKHCPHIICCKHFHEKMKFSSCMKDCVRSAVHLTARFSHTSNPLENAIFSLKSYFFRTFEVYVFHRRLRHPVFVILFRTTVWRAYLCVLHSMNDLRKPLELEDTVTALQTASSKASSRYFPLWKRTIWSGKPH